MDTSTDSPTSSDNEEQAIAPARAIINVVLMLARREISPIRVRGRILIRNPWQEINARRSLYSWVEAVSFYNMSVLHCKLVPPTTSTTAVACSPDGTMIASALTDYTIRIIDFETTRCKRILIGHERVILAVAFHPARPGILASGALDRQVRLWNVNTADCIGLHIFDHEITTIDFHALEELLAIAVHRQIYIWNYDQAGSTPAAVLSSHSSFFTVHFHPRAAPLLVTSEYNIPRSPHIPLEPSTYIRCRRQQLSTSDGGGFNLCQPCQPPLQMDEGEVMGLRNLERHRLLFPYIQRWVMDNSEHVSDPYGLVFFRNVALFFRNGILQYSIIEEYPRDLQSDLPFTFQLGVWPYDVRRPYAPIDPTTCRLTVSHVVLGRRGNHLGVHLSPCGRFLVACVACTLPGLACPCTNDEPLAEDEMYTVSFAGDRVVYELRVYSIEEATFGSIIVSRQIDTASYLTSIQFSPTSEHILVAYAEFHRSMDSSSYIGTELYTIIEAYRMRDMEDIPIVLSESDNVMVACFHPHPGRGVVYGIREGSTRFLRHDHRVNEELQHAAISEIDDEGLQ